MATVIKWTVSFRGDSGSGLCFCGLGARPHTCALGFRIQCSSLLLMGQIFGPFIPCSCLTTCLSSLATWGPESLGKGAETALASSCWTGGSWGPGPNAHTVRVHFWREMSVCGMRKPLVLARSMCQPACCISIWRFYLYSRRNKLNKKVRDTRPED